MYCVAVLCILKRHTERQEEERILTVFFNALRTLQVERTRTSNSYCETPGDEGEEKEGEKELQKGGDWQQEGGVRTGRQHSRATKTKGNKRGKRWWPVDFHLPRFSACLKDARAKKEESKQKR